MSKKIINEHYELINNLYVPFIASQVDTIKQEFEKILKSLSDEYFQSHLCMELARVWEGREEFMPESVRSVIPTIPNFQSGDDLVPYIKKICSDSATMVNESFIVPALEIEKLSNKSIEYTEHFIALMRKCDLYFQSITGSHDQLLMFTTPPFPILITRNNESVNLGDSSRLKIDTLDTRIRECHRISESGRSNLKELYKELERSIDTKIKYKDQAHDRYMKAKDRKQEHKFNLANQTAIKKIQCWTVMGSVALSLLFFAIGLTSESFLTGYKLSKVTEKLSEVQGKLESMSKKNMELEILNKKNEKLIYELQVKSVPHP